MKNVLVILMAALVVFPVAAQEDTGWIFRGRLIGVLPNDDASTILDTGTTVTVDDTYVPEVDLTKMLNANWGLELIAATSNHNITTEAGALGGADAGDVWVLPPTLTLQYHTGASEDFDFYAGIGVNFSLFYSYDLSDDLAALGVADIDFDESFGFSGQVGFDYNFNGNWVFNMDLKYIDMSTDAELKLADGSVLDTLQVDINPFVAGVGIGYRF